MGTLGSVALGTVQVDAGSGNVSLLQDQQVSAQSHELCTKYWHMTSFWGESSFLLAFAQDLDYRNQEKVMTWCQSVTSRAVPQPCTLLSDTQCICQPLLRAGWDFEFNLWPPTNYQPQCPWAVIDLVQEKDPTAGVQGRAAAHSPLQGKVLLTSLLTVSFIPRKELGFPVKQQAQQTKTTLNWPWSPAPVKLLLPLG